ncbi:MAG: hypothetical protein GXY13_05150 [Acidimicrobiales bacterium]|nr:hypothetical protein [Acidimicrobiales bacterium]
MDNSIWGMLNDAEQQLLRDVEPRALDGLDEDALSDLHDRVRRARNKYSKLYRRRAAAEVREAGARAKGHERHARTMIKAEAFEEALERVSRKLAAAAKASAAELKKERLAAARAAKAAAPKAARAAGGGKVAKGRKPAKKKAPVERKQVASARATKARTQAKRAAKKR